MALILAVLPARVAGDRVRAVLERGKLVELGRHDELLKQNGVYRRLVEHQVFADAPLPAVEEAA